MQQSNKHQLGANAVLTTFAVAHGVVGGHKEFEGPLGEAVRVWQRLSPDRQVGASLIFDAAAVKGSRGLLRGEEIRALAKRCNITS